MMREMFLPPLRCFVLAWQTHKRFFSARGARVARWALATVALIGLTSTARAQAPEDINLSSVTYIDQDNPTSNFGGKTQTKLVVNGLNHYGGTYVRGLLALPSITVPAGEQIQSVSLDLWCTQYSPPSGGSTTFSTVLYPLTRGFVQGTGTTSGVTNTSGATWNTYDGTDAWTTPGGDYDSSTPVMASATPAASSWTTFNLTNLWTNPSLVLEQQELQNYGALITVSPENYNLVSPSNSFITEEFASDVWVNSPPTPSLNPYIAVTFSAVPEPSTVALLAAGVGLAAIGFGRRWTARKGVAGTT
jgi:hypothetical protein